MKKILTSLFIAAALLAPTLASAQVFSQSQIINKPYGTGVIVSTTTGNGGHLESVATSTLNILTTDIVEGAKLFFTNARAIAATLTGYTSGAGTISSSDSILSAIQKLNGNDALRVTTISVASSNGFAGSSSGGTTPALTISTSITGLLKGNGTAVSAASNGTDFTLLTANTCGAGQFFNAATAAGIFTCGTPSGGGGGGGSGNVATSTTEAANQISVFSSNGATPATIAGYSGFTWDNSAGLLTVTGNASTTQFSTSNAAYFATSGGRVGIGTTSPTSALEVTSSGAASTIKVTGQSSSVGSGFTITDGLAATNLFTSVVNPSGTANSNLATVPLSATFQTGAGTTGGIYFVAKAANSPIVFGAGASAFTGERMRISGSTGFVGIGTTTPSAALAVQGNFFLAGNITATSTATSTFTGGIAGADFCTATKCLSSSGSGTGTVTSVALTVPTFLSISGSPITTSGTLAVTLSGTALPVLNGGTGLTSFTGDQIFYSNHAGTAILQAATSTLSIGGNAATATALAANGTNCSAGNYALGVDASGNSEGCTAVTSSQWTTSGSQIYYTGGNVGIGTTSPFAYLSVSTTTQDVATAAEFAVASTTNATHLIVLGNGNVGIGTTSPANLFSVGVPASSALSAYFVGNVGIGTQPIAKTLLSLSTTTLQGAAGAGQAILASVTYNGSSNTGRGSALNFQSNWAGTVNSTTVVQGGAAVGALGFAANTSIGLNAAMISGMYARCDNTGAFASTTNCNGMFIGGGNNVATGLISSSTSLYIQGGTEGGTVTNRNGIYIEPLIEGTNRYGIYQAGSGDLNYFAGNTGIGTTTPGQGQAFGVAGGGFYSGTVYANNFFDTSISGNTCVGESGGLLNTSNCVSSLASAGGSLTISSPTGNVDASLNVAHSNAFTALQSFANSSTTLASIIGTAYFGGTATTTINADGLGTISVANTTATSTLSHASATQFSIGSITGILTAVSGYIQQLTLSAGFSLSGTTLSQIEHRSFTYATSTAWTATTTIPLETGYGEVWNNAVCFTDAGTVNVDFYHSTNHLKLFNASTTQGTNTFPTNNTITSGDKTYVDIGTPASSPTKINCTIKDTI